MIGGAAHGGPRGMIHSLGSGESGKISGRILFRLLVFVRPYWRRLAAAGLLMVTASGASLLVPYLTKVVIDSNITSGDLHGLLSNAVFIGGAMVVGFLASALESYLLSRVGQLVLNNLRNRLFEHLQRLSVAYNDGHIVGVTISRVINDVSVINNLLSQGLLNMIGDTITIAGTVAVMLAMDARLALLTFCVIPFMVVATILFSRKARTAFLNTREKIGEVVGGLAENIGGIREIQAFAQEDHTHRRFAASNRENRDANVKAMTLSFIFMPTVDLLGIVSTGIVLLAGGLMVVHGQLTIGVMVAFMTYVSRFFMPIRDLSQFYTTLQSASAGGARVLELLDTPPLVVEARDPIELPSSNGSHRVQGRIVFDHVSFAYKAGVEVLHEIDFEVEPGSMVALVGPTGAGKTSISNLICRFYEPQAGRILIDGVDLRHIAQASLHSNMGYVPQTPFVFSGTIRENIAFGRPETDENTVRAAARAAEAAAFIEKLPEGYDTMIAEGGANLSTGQRQLICIARAVLVDPAIIILDEATSSVDTLTESLIQRALTRLLRDRTSIVIAHRLSTVRNADRIFVINGGRIVERGNHDELIARGGVYRTLYDRQFISEGDLER